MSLTKEQWAQLKYHYENLSSDTTLLVEYCGQRRMAIMTAYIDIQNTLKMITEQIEFEESGKKK